MGPTHPSTPPYPSLPPSYPFAPATPLLSLHSCFSSSHPLPTLSTPPHRLEAWLLFASALIVALAGVYSATRGDFEGQFVEAVLTTILLGSLFFSAKYLYSHYKEEVQRLAMAKIRQLRSTVRRSGLPMGGAFGPPVPAAAGEEGAPSYLTRVSEEGSACTFTSSAASRLIVMESEGMMGPSFTSSYASLRKSSATPPPLPPPSSAPTREFSWLEARRQRCKSSNSFPAARSLPYSAPRSTLA